MSSQFANFVLPLYGELGVCCDASDFRVLLVTGPKTGGLNASYFNVFDCCTPTIIPPPYAGLDGAFFLCAAAQQHAESVALSRARLLNVQIQEQVLEVKNGAKGSNRKGAGMWRSVIALLNGTLALYAVPITLVPEARVR